jgi:lipopolysaccharide/colanic/teichoic acid biosynthesis glycosyltransferase
MKRIGDLVIACTLIAFTLPLTTIVALAIKLDSPGPVFSRRDRLGLGGRQIGALQFRTRVHHPQRTRRQDVQLTRVGWFLRYIRIDELPQLVNVLRGEMSLFGTSRERPDFLR